MLYIDGSKTEGWWSHNQVDKNMVRRTKYPSDKHSRFKTIYEWEAGKVFRDISLDWQLNLFVRPQDLQGDAIIVFSNGLCYKG